MRTLGFDLATSTGWAVFDDTELGAYGVIKLKRDHHRQSINMFVRLLEAHKPDRVAIEHIPFSQRANALASYSRVRTLLEIAMEEEGYAYTAINTATPSEIKKWATGNGRAPKALMCSAVREWYALDLWAVDETPPDNRTKAQRKREEDMADAIWVAAHVAHLDN